MTEQRCEHGLPYSHETFDAKRNPPVQWCVPSPGVDTPSPKPQTSEKQAEFREWLGQQAVVPGRPPSDYTDDGNTAPLLPDEARLRELEAAATPTPWHHDDEPDNEDGIEFFDILGGGERGSMAEHQVAVLQTFLNKRALDDSRLIVAARNALPSLLAERDALQAEVETLKTWQAKRLVAISEDPIFGSVVTECEELRAELSLLREQRDNLCEHIATEIERVRDSAEHLERCSLTEAAAIVRRQKRVSE